MDGDQLLFEDMLAPPIAHRADPDTSAIAARNHCASGKRTRHANMVLALVRALPGRTAIELWHEADAELQAELKEPQEIRRRCTDLLHLGLVRQGEQRRCRHKGTTMVVWHATEAQV